MKNIIYLLLVVFCCSCASDSNTEYHKQKRDNIVFVGDKLFEIDFDDILFSQLARLCVMNNYLVISDAGSFDKQVNIFNVNDFSFLANVADRGQGPNDITNLGFIGINEKNNEFYITDHGKQKIFCYKMDSIFDNPLYVPTVKMRMSERQFPNSYQFINDSLLIGLIIVPTGNSGYNHLVATINTISGEIKPMRYDHPQIKKKRVSVAMSEKHNIYVECYHYHDLMSIYNMDGSIKKNIYGKKWNSMVSNQYGYYSNVIFCGDYIVASYANGKDRYSNTEDGSPTQFLIFNIDGDYVKTLETNQYITDYCYDKFNNRILMHLNSEIQFAFLNLNDFLSENDILEMDDDNPVFVL